MPRVPTLGTLSSCFPSQKLSHRWTTEGPFLTCTLVSGEVVGLDACGLAFLTSILWALALFWLHSRAGSHRLTCSLGDPIPGLSPVPNWERTVNTLLWVYLNTSALLDFVPNQQVLVARRSASWQELVGGKEQTQCGPLVKLLIMQSYPTIG